MVCPQLDRSQGRGRSTSPTSTGSVARTKQWSAYGQSKLANLLFVLELERRLTAAGSDVRAMAAHPGFARTNLQGHSGNAWADRATLMVTKVVGQSAAQGAWPTLFAALEDLPGGSYAGPGGFAETRGIPQLVGRTPEASDPELAKQLWTASEGLTGISFPALTTSPVKIQRRSARSQLPA